MHCIQGVDYVPQQDVGMSQADHPTVVTPGINELPKGSAIGGLAGDVDPITLGAPSNQRRQVLVWHAGSLAKVSLRNGSRHSLRAEDTQGYRGAAFGILRLVDLAAAFLSDEALDLEAAADERASSDLVLPFQVCGKRMAHGRSDTTGSFPIDGNRNFRERGRGVDIPTCPDMNDLVPYTANFTRS